jgi:hypothetical protein
MAIYTAFPTKEQEKLLLTFLKTNNIDFINNEEKLPAHVLEGIERGLEDVRGGRTITFEEFKNKFPVK